MLGEPLNPCSQHQAFYAFQKIYKPFAFKFQDPNFKKITSTVHETSGSLISGGPIKAALKPLSAIMF